VVVGEEVGAALGVVSLVVDFFQSAASLSTSEAYSKGTNSRLDVESRLLSNHAPAPTGEKFFGTQRAFFLKRDSLVTRKNTGKLFKILAPQ
jgi:hypothetical protein